MVDDFYFWYFVEGVTICHEGTDALAEVTNLDADIPQEGAACPSSYDHDCFQVHFGQIEFHGKPILHGVSAHPDKIILDKQVCIAFLSCIALDGS